MTAGPTLTPGPPEGEDERYRQREERTELVEARENIDHATAATQHYMQTTTSPRDRQAEDGSAGTGTAERSEVSGEAVVLVEGEAVESTEGQARIPGESRVQQQGRADLTARQRGYAAQPDNTPYSDEVGEDRRAHSRQEKTGVTREL